MKAEERLRNTVFANRSASTFFDLETKEKEIEMKQTERLLMLETTSKISFSSRLLLIVLISVWLSEKILFYLLTTRMLDIIYLCSTIAFHFEVL